MKQIKQIILTVTVLSIFSACAGKKPVTNIPQDLQGKMENMEERLLENPDKNLPAWILNPKSADKGDRVAFAGISRKWATEVEARADAVVNARSQMAEYMSIHIKRLTEEVKSTLGDSADILTGGVSMDVSTRQKAEVELGGTRPERIYIQKWVRYDYGEMVTFYNAYSLMYLSKDAPIKALQETLNKEREKTQQGKKAKQIDRAVKYLETLREQGWEIQ